MASHPHPLRNHPDGLAAALGALHILAALGLDPTSEDGQRFALRVQGRLEVSPEAVELAAGIQRVLEAQHGGGAVVIEELDDGWCFAHPA